jgi:hypothetical protein
MLCCCTCMYCHDPRTREACLSPISLLVEPSRCSLWPDIAAGIEQSTDRKNCRTRVPGKIAAGRWTCTPALVPVLECGVPTSRGLVEASHSHCIPIYHVSNRMAIYRLLLVQHAMTAPSADRLPTLSPHHKTRSRQPTWIRQTHSFSLTRQIRLCTPSTGRPRPWGWVSQRRASSAKQSAPVEMRTTTTNPIYGEK